MTQITNNGYTFLVLDVPVHAEYHMYWNGTNYTLIVGTSKAIQLPSGQCSILGTVNKYWVFGFDVIETGLVNDAFVPANFAARSLLKSNGVVMKKGMNKLILKLNK
jgi:hypothetical protein